MSYTILVVDDEPDVVEFLKTLLEDNKYIVNTAMDGNEAMIQVQKSKPDLILLDLFMPEETGTGFYRKLKRKKEYENIPIIVVSGLAGRNVSVSKSVVVIDKPFEEDKILYEVHRALHPLKKVNQ